MTVTLGPDVPARTVVGSAHWDLRTKQMRVWNGKRWMVVRNEGRVRAWLRRVWALRPWSVPAVGEYKVFGHSHFRAETSAEVWARRRERQLREARQRVPIWWEGL